jgi:hypothetical protein
LPVAEPNFDLLQDLNGAYEKVSNRLIVQAGVQAKADFLSLPNWRDDNKAEFYDAIRRDLLPVKQQAAQFSWGYHAQRARLAGQEFRMPRFNPEDFETSVLRNGAAFEEVYQRPFAEMRTALAQGRSFDDALELGGRRASTLAQTEVQLSRRQASLFARNRNDNIVGYLRVLSGSENCALCFVASTQRYTRGELLPIHPGCDCGEMPIYGNSDPGQVIDEYNLEKAHQQVEARFGISDRGAREIDYRQIIVSEHGEMGPLLSVRGQKFTGPNALNLVGSKVRKLDPPPVPLFEATDPYFDAGIAARYSQEAVDAADPVFIRAAINEPSITDRLVKLADEAGGEMAMLESRLKQRESLARKITQDAAEKNVTLQEAADSIGDAIRYTMLLDPQDYAATAQKVVNDFEAQGFDVFKFKNYWQEGNSYKGINTNIRTPDGTVFELQFHTPQSLAVKQPSHEIFERSRVTTNPREKIALETESRNLWQSVDTPANIEGVGTASFN